MTGSAQRVAASAFLAAMAVLTIVVSVYAAEPTQLSYVSSDEAVAALVTAARSNDTAALRTILGPGSAPLISSGDKYADEAALRHFIELYDARHALMPDGADHVMLEVGANGWALPLPIVRRAERWSFDAREGAQEIIDRRIGRNEISAIRVCLAYVDAQTDYFERKKQATGSGMYAQQLVSAQGRHDGLYWPAGDGQDESPLQPLVAQAQDEGYPGQMQRQNLVPYQGYFFRILFSQRAEAPGGAKKYVQNGRMTGGFALIAWPANYAASGIMSFIVNQDGVVFQKDLGPQTARSAASIAQFNSDPSWARIEVTDQ